MSVKISWNNKREYEKIRVYRSESKIELDALPTVLSEVAGDATFYVDIEAKNNTVYHYRLGKVSKEDGIERFSENQTFGNFPETGHGWPTIIRGTWESGYYGTLTETELFTSTDIINKLNERLTTPLIQMNADTSPIWHKVIYDGKILFVPNGPIGGRYSSRTVMVTNSIDWRLLYKAGAVYGTDGPGPLPENIGFGPVDQDLSITKDGRTYRIRLPKIFNSNVSGMLEFDDISNTFEEAVTYTDFRNSEYSSVINAIRRDSKLLNGTIRLGNEPSSGYTSGYGGIWHRMLSQDLVTKGSEISAIDIWDVTVTAKELFAPSRDSELDTTVNETLSNSNAWWPVLELILD